MCLAWTQCYGDGGVQLRTFACNTNAGSNRLVASYDALGNSTAAVFDPLGRRIQLIVNQTRKPGEGRTVRQQLQLVVDRFVNTGLDSPVRIELLGEIPSDNAVRDAVQRRQLLLESMPGTPAAVALGAIALRIPL